MTETKTVTMLDAADLAYECAAAVEEHVNERFVLIGARAWPQVISNSRYMLTIQVDIEKYRVIRQGGSPGLDNKGDTTSGIERTA